MTSIQFIKLLILYSVLSLSSFVAIIINKSFIVQSTEYLDVISPYIFGFTATTVFFLLKFMDSISTSMSSVKNEGNDNKINKVQNSFLNLNQEGIANVILSLSLFILAKLIKLQNLEVELSGFQVTVLCLKFSCLATMLYVVFDQIGSLHTAMQYRRIIEENKK
ncbi:MAG: hypothetical protein ACYDH1_20835 [Anaerolineaceae bacterium]